MTDSPSNVRASLDGTLDGTLRETFHGTGRLLTFSAAASLAVLGSRGLPPARLAVPLAVAAIAVAVWHGAFDGVLAEESFEPQFGSAWRSAFHAAYLALAAAVVLLWWAVPVSALVFFLLYSALHFGTEGEQHLSPTRVLTGVATGFVPIAAACHWWPREVTAIFAEMLRGGAERGAGVTFVAGRVLWPVVAVAVVGAWRGRGEVLPTLAALILVATELALFRWCSPLAAFAVFFCLWHTPEHMVGTSLDRAGRFQVRRLGEHLRRGLVPWLGSLAAMAIMGWYGRHTAQAYAGVVFVVLSALTVPHMVLGELCRRRQILVSEGSGTGFATALR